jgi:hypothetical protein
MLCYAKQSKATWCNCSGYTPKQMLQQRVIEWQKLVDTMNNSRQQGITEETALSME